MIKVDPHSETWQAIKAHVKDAVDAHRRVCETPGAPMSDTENARGAIMALNGLLKLGGEGASQTPRSE